MSRRRPWTSLLAEKQHLLLLAFAVVSVGLQVWGFHDLRHDDAYITYRYGQNLAGGEGPVFNPGERLLGSTAPGHLLLAALLYPVFGVGGLPTAMAVLGCVAWSAQAGAVLYLLRRAIGAVPALLVALCVAAGAAGSAQWVALETNLSVALALWAFVAALASRWSSAAALAGAAVLVRPDALLVAVLLAPLALRALRRNAWRPAVVFLAFALPWPLFAWAYYGSPLPRSAVTKVGASSVGDYATHIVEFTSHQVGADAIATLPWLLAVVGAVLLVRRDPGLWVLPAYSLAHFAAYALLHPPHNFTWHLYPGVLVFTVLALGGIGVLARFARRRLVSMGACLVLVAIVGWYGARTVGFARTHHDDYWYGARDRVYREIAGYLGEHAGAGDRVVAHEIGTLGFYAGRPVHDLTGLVTRDPQVLTRDIRWVVLVPHTALRARGEPTARFVANRFRAELHQIAPAATTRPAATR